MQFKFLFFLFSEKIKVKELFIKLKSISFGLKRVPARCCYEMHVLYGIKFDLIFEISLLASIKMNLVLTYVFETLKEDIETVLKNS